MPNNQKFRLAIKRSRNSVRSFSSCTQEGLQGLTLKKRERLRKENKGGKAQEGVREGEFLRRKLLQYCDLFLALFEVCKGKRDISLEPFLSLFPISRFFIGLFQMAFHLSSEITCCLPFQQEY